MLRSVLLFIAAAMGLAAADFSGRWVGTIETGDARMPIYFTFVEQGGKVGGEVAVGKGGRAVPLEAVDLRNGELSFQVHDNANRLMQFRLTLANDVLAGEATVGGQMSKVVVVQAFGGGGGSRTPMRSDSGTGSGIGSGVLRVGGGVSVPQLIHKVEPEYTQEARNAKYQGTVLLYVEIAPDGRATNIKVQRSLGLGLDEKAIECVKQWVFKPGEKDGKPVTVAATIEVNFRM